eukprot:scaffold78825_cov78-Phaeocystis_antarctica.AAC.2
MMHRRSGASVTTSAPVLCDKQVVLPPLARLARSSAQPEPSSLLAPCCRRGGGAGWVRSAGFGEVLGFGELNAGVEGELRLRVGSGSRLAKRSSLRGVRGARRCLVIGV